MRDGIPANSVMKISLPGREGGGGRGGANHLNSFHPGTLAFRQIGGRKRRGGGVEEE